MSMLVEMWSMHHLRSTFGYMSLLQRPCLYKVYLVFGGQADRRALYTQLRELCSVEGQAFLHYRRVFVCDFNGRALTWQHVVLLFRWRHGSLLSPELWEALDKWQATAWHMNKPPVWCMRESSIISNTKQAHTNSLASSSLVVFVFLFPPQTLLIFHQHFIRLINISPAFLCLPTIKTIQLI